MSAIPQPPRPAAAVPGVLNQPPPAQPRETRITKRAGRPWRYLLPLLAGVAAAALPAVRALDGTVDNQHGAGPWLAAAVVAALGTAILSTITCLYRDRQETRRREIELHGVEVLAAAFARAIDATHTMAQNLPPAREMAEAARVRDSARQIAADLVPVIETLAQLPCAALFQERPEAEIEPEAAQLADQVAAN